MVKIDEIPDTHGELRDTLAGLQRPERAEPEEGDEDPDFLPQESLRQTGATTYEKVGGTAAEERSDIFEERLRRANELKEEATEKFKGGRFAAAKQTYRRAFHHVDYSDLERLQFAEHHAKMIDDTQRPILLNLAQTALKLAEEAAASAAANGGGPSSHDPLSYYAGETEANLVDTYRTELNKTPECKQQVDKQLRAAVVYCSTLLSFDKDNVKALYRRGLARERSGNAEDALPDFRRAKSLLPKTHGTYATVLKALRRATASSKVERQERERTWRGKLDQTASNSTPAPTDAAPEPEQEQEGSFISADSWEGAKVGFEFKLGDDGLGYYRTSVPNTFSCCPTASGNGAKAKTNQVRPPLKMRGVMAERGATLKRQLLEKMEVGSTAGKVRSGDAFRAFNKSKSGFLSYKELQAGLTTLKISHSEDSKDMRRLLDRIDLNRDGKVCKADFRNFLGLDDGTDSDSDSDSSCSDDHLMQSSGGRAQTKDKRSWKEVAVSLVLPVYLPGMLFTAAGALAAPSMTLLAVELGGSKAAAGVALSLRAMASLVMQVPAARFLAARGCRQTMLTGGVASALASMLIAGASTMQSFVLFQLSLLVTGFGAAMWEVSRQAQMAAAIPPHVRGKAVALFGGVVRVAAVGGPMLGGLVTQRAGQASVFLLESVALIVAAMSSRFVSNTTQRIGGGGARGRKNKKRPKMSAKGSPTLSETLREHLSRFLTAGVSSALLSLVRAARSVALPMIGSEIGLNPLQIGTCLSVASAIEAPLFIPAGWAYDRFGRKPVIVPGTATVAAAWAVLATVSTQRGMWIAAAVRCTLLPFVFGAYRLLVLRQLLLAQRSVAMLIRNLLGVGNGLLSGAGTLTCQDFAPTDKHKPNYFAIWSVYTGVATMMAPNLIGGIAERTSIFTAAAVTSALGLGSAGWYAILVPEMHHGAREARARAS